MNAMVRACRLSIYLGNADISHHQSVSGTILRRAHRAGIGGASTLQGIAGFGHSHEIHNRPIWRLVDRTPITVHIIDTPDKIRGFLSALDDLADQCLVVCDAVEVVSSLQWR